MTKSFKNRHVESGKAHWVEWATRVVSFLLVLSMIGWIAMDALVRDDVPPSFELTVTRTAAAEGGFRLEFDILNQGTSTAAAVLVRADVVDEGQIVDTVEVTLDYVPGRSTASGGLFLLQDPAGQEVRLRALGYTDP